MELSFATATNPGGHKNPRSNKAICTHEIPEKTVPVLMELDALPMPMSRPPRTPLPTGNISGLKLLTFHFWAHLNHILRSHTQNQVLPSRIQKHVQRLGRTWFCV